MNRKLRRPIPCGWARLATRRRDGRGTVSGSGFPLIPFETPSRPHRNPVETPSRHHASNWLATRSQLATITLASGLRRLRRTAGPARSEELNCSPSRPLRLPPIDRMLSAPCTHFASQSPRIVGFSFSSSGGEGWGKEAVTSGASRCPCLPQRLCLPPQLSPRAALR